MSLPEPAFEKNGDPTDASLAIIEVWPYLDFLTLMDYVRKCWSDYGRFERDGDFFILATGGHSANELVIGAMQKNFIFWATCWELSRRGGYFEFKIPRRP